MRFAFIAILFALNSVPSNGQNASITDSLEHILPQAQGKDKVRILNDLSWEYGFSNPEKALSYGRESVELAEELGDDWSIAEAANILAIALHRTGDFTGAIEMNRKALSIRKQSGNLRDVGSSLSKIGLAFSEQLILDSAIFYTLQGLEAFESANDSVAAAQMVTNLASLFDKNKDLEKAVQYARKAVQLFDKLNYAYGKAGALGTLSMMLDKQGDYDSAILYGYEALELFRGINSKTDIATQLNNLGFYERKRGKLNEGLSLYREAYSIADSIGDHFGKAKYTANQAAVLVDLGRFSEASELYRNSLSAALEHGYFDIKLQSLEGLANSLQGEKEYAEAFNYFRQYASLHDSLYNQEKNAQIQELETRYQTRKKEQENEFLRQENDIASLENTKSNTLLWTSAGSFFLLLAAGGLFIARSRARQKAVYRNELLHIKQKGLDGIIQATEAERKRIARELHDGIGQQLGGMKMGWELMLSEWETPPEHAKQLSEVLNDACTDVRALSHQMMPRALGEIGLVPALNDLLEKVFRGSAIIWHFEHFHAESRFPENIEIALYRIVQELATNVIRSSGATEAYIQLFRNKNTLLLLVEDNGQGKTATSETERLGFMTIAGRLSTINGEVHYEPGPNSGTVATVRIPLQ